MRVEAVRVLDLRADGAALARWRQVPRAPFAPQEQRMWFQPSASGWWARGDGGAARIALRHALVLAPDGLDDSAVHALPGLLCGPDAAAPGGESCSSRASPNGTPLAGLLDLGARGDGAFGVLGLFRADSGSVAERLAAAAAQTRRWGAASARARRQLLFELDAREIDDRVARVRIRGGALPADGVQLVPPALTVNGPLFEHWPLAVDDGTDWSGLPWGWCLAGTPAGDCSRAWDSMHAGAVLRIELLDAGSLVIESIDLPLPPEPEAEALQADAAGARMARFDSGAADTFTPHYAQVLALGDTKLTARLRWRAPPPPATLSLRLHWQRADALAQGGTEDRHRRLPLDAASSGPLELRFAPRSGWASTWWSARLDTTPGHGLLRYIHVIAPTNPS
jgi:hypothetical protein